MSRRTGIFYSIFTVIIPIFIQIGFIIYVAHKVDRVHYGYFVLIQTVISGFSALLLTIPAAAFTRFYNKPGKRDRFLNEFRTLNFGISILAIVLSLLIWISGFTGFSFSEAMIIGITSSLAFSFSLKKTSVFLEVERRKTFIISVIEKVSRFIFPIILYIIFQSSMSLMLGLVLGLIILNIMTTPYCRFPKYQFSISKVRQALYFRYAWPLLFVALFSWVVSFSDRYFIDQFLTKNEVGEYSILAQFSGFMFIFGSVYTIYVNPILYKLFGSSKSLGYALFYKSIFALVLMLVCLFVLYLCLPSPIIAVFISPELMSKAGYKTVLDILVASALVSVLVTAFSLKYTLSKRLDVLATGWLLAASANLIGNFLIRDYGIIAAAYSTLMANVTVILALLIYEAHQKFLTKPINS